MNNKGFYISIDTALLAIVFFAFISATSVHFESSFYEIAMAQKMDDLLIVWTKERNFSAKELSEDFEFVFEGKKGTIEIGGQKIEIGKTRPWKQIFSKEIIFLDDSLRQSKIRLVVFD